MTKTSDNERTAFIQKMKGIDLPGWLVSMRYEHLLEFKHEETGAEFCVSTPKGWGADRHKVEAFASYPRDSEGNSMSARDWGLVRYNESDPNRIGFSATKPVEAIARDLQRRLIPGVLSSFQAIQAKMAEQAASKSTIETAVQRVKSAFGVVADHDVRDVNHYGATIHFGQYRSRAKLRIDGEAVEIDLELGQLTIEQVEAIAAIVGGGK